MDKIIVYKLTDKNYQTYNSTQWGKGITHKVSGEGEMCDSGFIHAYETPYHAGLFVPIHIVNFNINTYYLWECEAIVKKHDGIKIGCTELTTIKIIDKPKITIMQRIYFGYLCVKYILSAFENVYPNNKKIKKLLNKIEKYLNIEETNNNIIIKKNNAIKINNFNTNAVFEFVRVVNGIDDNEQYKKLLNTFKKHLNIKGDNIKDGNIIEIAHLAANAVNAVYEAVCVINGIDYNINIDYTADIDYITFSIANAALYAVDAVNIIDINHAVNSIMMISNNIKRMIEMDFFKKNSKIS